MCTIEEYIVRGGSGGPPDNMPKEIRLRYCTDLFELLQRVVVANDLFRSKGHSEIVGKLDTVAKNLAGRLETSVGQLGDANKVQADQAALMERYLNK